LPVVPYRTITKGQKKSGPSGSSSHSLKLVRSGRGISK
jgi:hypothetical protein